MNYIPADKLLAEIERRIAICKRVTGDERNEEDMKRYYKGKVVALEEIRHLADSLQQEQPEVELEEEIEEWWQNWVSPPRNEYAVFDKEEFINIVRHFYELGLDSRKEK